MRNVKLTIEYDGQNYKGWQWQPDLRTIQGEMITALQRILQHPAKVIGAARTDVGVHALGQVANVKIEKEVNLLKLQRGLNAVLPPEIRVKEACEVPLEFHARFDAVARQYTYRIWKGERAIGRQYGWCYSRSLQLERMRQATDKLLGEHDFRGFCKRGDDIDNYHCRVQEIQWSEDDEAIQLSIKADHFLHNMVRAITGTAVEVGRGKCDPQEVQRILESGDKRRIGPTAPAHGLCLVRVFY